MPRKKNPSSPDRIPSEIRERAALAAAARLDPSGSGALSLAAIADASGMTRTIAKKVVRSLRCEGRWPWPPTRGASAPGSRASAPGSAPPAAVIRMVAETSPGLGRDAIAAESGRRLGRPVRPCEVDAALTVVRDPAPGISPDEPDGLGRRALMVLGSILDAEAGSFDGPDPSPWSRPGIPWVPSRAPVRFEGPSGPSASRDRFGRRIDSEGVPLRDPIADILAEWKAWRAGVGPNPILASLADGSLDEDAA